MTPAQRAKAAKDNIVEFKPRQSVHQWNTQCPGDAGDGRLVEVLHADGRTFRCRWGQLDSWYVWDWRIPGFEHGTWDKIIAWRNV